MNGSVAPTNWGVIGWSLGPRTSCTPPMAFGELWRRRRSVDERVSLEGVGAHLRRVTQRLHHRRRLVAADLGRVDDEDLQRQRRHGGGLSLHRHGRAWSILHGSRAGRAPASLPRYL